MLKSHAIWLRYGPASDVWSLGCIIGELLSGMSKALFACDDGSEWGTLKAVFQALGSPTETTWPGVSKLKRTDMSRQHPLTVVYPRPAQSVMMLRATRKEPVPAPAGTFVAQILQACPACRILAEAAGDSPWFQPRKRPGLGSKAVPLKPVAM